MYILHKKNICKVTGSYKIITNGMFCVFYITNSEWIHTYLFISDVFGKPVF